MKAFKNNLYRHFKTGKIYRVLAIAKHTETREDFVVYECCLNQDSWARPLDMFEGTVEDENGETVHRFRIVFRDDAIS